MKYAEKQLQDFLKESNAIEGVYDLASLEQALVAWKYLAAQPKMTPSVVLNTHKLLMLNQPGLMSDEKGYFRHVSVMVGNYKAPHHLRVREEIEDWCEEMNQGGGEEQSKWLHVQYEKIHPFVDGNGRTGRMFMNWWRVRNRLPLLIIHAGQEQYEYYKWFAKA